MQLTKNCPHCQSGLSLVIEKDTISCTKKSCGFSVHYACPICDHTLPESDFKEDEKGSFFVCNTCKNKFYLKRIHYLIENDFYIDNKTRCSICNGPTIYRKGLGLAHRCLFFPGCSGQMDLFGNVQKESLVFLDFETTGLEVGKDEIIEIGAIKLDEEGYDHTFQTLVKPNKPISGYITKLTGITEEMVADAPDLKTAMTRFADFIGNAIIVTHNTDFDIPWLITSCLRYDIPILAKQSICTYKWAVKLNEPAKSLPALTKKYRIYHKNAHRALADSLATRELFFIFENLNKESRPIQTIKE